MKANQIDLVDMLDGMRAAEENANRKEQGWSLRALSALLDTGKRLGTFTIEDLRESCQVDSPTDQRAWGGVINYASRHKLIRRVGYAPARSSNGSPKPVWEVIQ